MGHEIHRALYCMGAPERHTVQAFPRLRGRSAPCSEVGKPVLAPMTKMTRFQDPQVSGCFNASHLHPHFY